MSRRVVIATDLDRTLIYSRAAAGVAASGFDVTGVDAAGIDVAGLEPSVLRCVEHYGGEPASFMTAAAAELLVGLADDAWLVPVTTRTREQLARVELPGGPNEWAIAANGATILHRGVVDGEWTAEVTRRLAGSSPLAEFRADLQQEFQLPEPGQGWLASLRDADGYFCYAVVQREDVPAEFLTEAAEWAAARGWRMSVQGRKVYWVPDALTKAAAVAEVARRVGAERVLAAGDSLLDLDLLLAADAGIVAAHGELAGQLPLGSGLGSEDSSVPGSPPSSEHGSGLSSGLVVTVDRGAAAGEEICGWFRRQLEVATHSMWRGSQAIVG